MFSLTFIGAISLIQPAKTEFGKITLPLGMVEVQSKGGNDWARAKVRQPVFAGDKVRTKPKARAEITLNGGGKLRISENSELELTTPKFSLGPVQTIQAPTQVAGPYEVTLEEWITLVEGMQINLRSDGKYSMFEFDKEADSKDPWVMWNLEQDSK